MVIKWIQRIDYSDKKIGTTYVSAPIKIYFLILIVFETVTST